MSNKRVKYYSNNDMSISFYLERLKLIADSLDTSTELSNINDALELVNLTKFIDNNLFSTEWKSDYREELVSKAKVAKGLLGKYFSSLSVEDITGAVSVLENEYYDDFIATFSIYKLVDKVTEDEFENLLSGSSVPIWDILESKYLVDKFPKTLKKLFLSSPRNFETFLSNYTYSHNKRKLYIPKNISKEDMLALCQKYIESDKANPNYLDILLKPIRGTEEYISIDASTKVKIKKRNEEIQNKLFGDLSKGGGLSIKLAILSSKKAYDEEVKGSSPTDMISYVESSWIEAHTDYPTLLNNFQYLYDFFTEDLISTLPSFPNAEMGIVERHMGVTTENSYIIGQFFGLKHQMATGKLRIISEFTTRHKISLEDIIDWFFSTYSKDEFSLKWLSLNMPSSSEHTANKTATLFRIEESVRTQYSVFADTGSIDSEIVNLTSTPAIRGLKSAIENKYAYLSEDDVSHSIVNLLYSSQSSLTYIDDKRQSHDFASLIIKQQLKATDFHDYQKPRIDYLIQHGVLTKRKDDTLKFKNVNVLYVYKMLFAYGVVGYHHVKPGIQKTIDSMYAEGRLVFEATLFTRQESDYLNFVLNNSQFDNSWAIRNSYQHGTPTYEDENHYLFDYYIALLILLIYVIKINDELSLRKVANGEEPAYADIN
ncbi:MAG: hypothetical protein UY35_C0001G0018 [Candidatus Saccharibacteria bacterium GW2011_GWC2_48_9]|nr:MAG: hypothetical protein UY35_C0001G0018 [Candidatus Saccharibacteria bacterium GW2011_GWC2_48_9]HCH34391.1 hypothetical protein [Candidatus Saccharibacteria bacterium]